MLKKVPSNFKASLLGKELLPVPSAKDLGVVIDSSSRLNEQVTQTVSKCIASLSQINRMKYALDRKTQIIIINALVFSRLFYCSCVWGSTSKKNISKLQKVQNFGARIITSSRKYDHISSTKFEELGWLPVESIVKLKDVTMMFKCMNDLAPKYLSDNFICRSGADVHSRNTTSKSKLNIPLCKSATGQRAFVYRATTIWNNLPDDMRNIQDLNVFIISCKEMFFNKRL